MRVYLRQNVFDAALERIRHLFAEFPNVVVNVSGGKDSTVVLNLALKVAEELGRLPLPVMFIDQEAEWSTVIDYIREIMADPRVKPYWLQVPIKLFNATSTLDPWLQCWEPGAEWIRPKEPNSIHDNVYGTDRFGKLFSAFLAHEYGEAKVCNIAGVRAEESPARLSGLTSYETYKGITWGKVEDKARQHFVFYPLYDWSYTDVWKAIHDNGWSYCPVYDFMYQYGVPVSQMRVTNVHHETAVHTLMYLQEVEAETWNRVTRRLSGINTAGQLQAQFWCPTELPWMFADWREYRDHLLANLITDPDARDLLARQFAAYDERYVEEAQAALVKTQISIILTNDYHGTKLQTFRAAHMRHSKNRGAKRREFNT